MTENLEISRQVTPPAPDGPAVGRPATAPLPPVSMARIGRHGLIYGIGIIATKGIGFLMLPIYTRYLTPADYGVLQLVTMVLEAASVFAGARIAQGIFRFYHKAESLQERNEVMFTSLALLTLSYAVVSGLSFIAARPIARAVFEAEGQYVFYVRLAAAGLAFQTLVLVPFAFLRLRDKSTLFVIWSVVQLALQATLNVVLLIPFRLGVAAVLISSLVSHVTLGFVLVVLMIRQVGTRFSIQSARDLIRFGVPLIVMQVASFIMAFADRYFLVRAANTAVVGIYGLALQFGMLLLLVGYMPFSRVWEPMRFEIANRSDRDAIYARVFILMNVVLITAGLLIALFAHDLLVLVATPPFYAAHVLVPPLVLAFLLQCWMHFFNVAIFVKERTEFFTIATWIAAAVAVLGYLVLIPRYLALGAVLTTAIAYLVRFWLVYLFGQRLWRVEYQWGPVLKLLAMAIGVYTMVAVLPLPNHLVALSVKLLLVIAYGFGLWTTGVLSPSDRRQIRRMLGAGPLRLARLFG